MQKFCNVPPHPFKINTLKVHCQYLIIKHHNLYENKRKTKIKYSDWRIIGITDTRNISNNNNKTVNKLR